jgi:hypothetical protein
VRHELQLRGDCARDRFIQLRADLLRQQGREPLLQTAEQDFVKMTLKQDLAYRDTSRWAGGPKPKNWAQVAVEPAWWSQAVGEARDSFAYSRRPKTSLDAAKQACSDQYGPKLVAWVLKQAINTSQAPQRVLHRLFVELVSLTGDNLAERVFQELPGAEYGQVQEVVLRFQRFAAEFPDADPVALARLMEGTLGE